MIKKGKKITILGAGNVGATCAYTLTLAGLAAEIVMIDINENKAKGEAMDIVQGTAFCPPVNIHAGLPSDAIDSDIVVVTAGVGRKVGQSRIDLAQINVNIMRSSIPEIVKYAPNAIYVVVSNPVDILTYAILKISGLPSNQVIGSGTMLDTTRLKTILAKYVGINSHDVHAYVFGEHGDTAMIPWSLTSIGGMEIEEFYDSVCKEPDKSKKIDLCSITDEVRNAGSKVIELKGATYYAVALAVRRICDAIIRDSNSVMTVSSMIQGQHGIHDVCLSLPSIVGARGIIQIVTSPLTAEEENQLQYSSDTLHNVLNSLDI